jgi:hypothetical protein
MSGATSFANPLKTGPTVLVAALGGAEGARGAAAALACAGADLDLATLFIDVGGRAPRPALLTSAGAQALEERLATHLPDARVAARGQVCHLAVSADIEGLKSAVAAVAVARETTSVVHVPPHLLQEALDSGLRPSGVLLRVELAEDRALLSLAARDLLGRGLAFAVLKQRLSWVAERRAFFGALPAGSQGALPPRLLRRLGISA